MREVVTVHRLLQFKQHVFPPVSLQAARHFFPARPDPVMFQIRQFPGVPLSLQNRGNDLLSAESVDVADHIGQLNVHFRQRFLHVLYRPSRFLDVPISQAPDRAHAFHLLRQPEGVAQQPVGVQFHQPLAFLHIGFSPGYVFGVLRIRQHHPDAMLLENVVQSDPVHARGLHGVYERLHLSRAMRLYVSA